MEFNNCFKKSEWDKLDHDTKLKHSRKSCNICPNIPEWYNFKKNSKAPAVIRELDAGVRRAMAEASRRGKEAVMKDLNNVVNPVFQREFGCNLEQMVISSSNVVQNTVNQLGDFMVDKTLSSTLTNQVSFRTVRNFRRNICFNTPSKSPVKKTRSCSTVFKHENFVFDRQRVAEALRSVGDRKINWSELARRFPVRKEGNDNIVKCGPQVLKSYAISAKLIIEHKISPRIRRSRRKLNISGQSVTISNLFPSNQKLTARLKAQIRDGDIDIGKNVVPVTFKYKVVDSEGKLIMKEVTMNGRSFDLQSILQRSIQHHEKLGLLRKPYPEDYSLDQATTELRNLGKLRNKVNKKLN